MNITRPIIVGIAAIILVFTKPQIAESQNIKYDDIIEELEQLTPRQRYSRFFQYQRQDPHFANTYIQLGDACEKIFHGFDPLREFNQVNYWVRNAALYYGLLPVYLRGNEVRRNREYYQNFNIETQGRRLDQEDVLIYAQQRLEYCGNFRDSLNLIFNSLERSKDHYNNCVRLFNQINEQFDNINEALLQTNDVLLQLLSELDKEYNATLKEFENYKMLIGKFPIGNYNQNYEVLPIQTFRLEGLTNSDFLMNSFTIWDYGKWVNNFKNTYNTDIVTLRNEIHSIQRTFNNNRRRISNVTSLDEEETFDTYPDLFMYRLGKYDNSSLVRELFRYLEARQNFLVMNKQPANLPTDSSSGLMNRKLRFYHRLVQEKVHTLDLLNHFNNAITQERVRRFNDFFEQQYKGEEGLRQFYREDKGFIWQTQEHSFGNLKSYLQKESIYRQAQGNATGSRGLSIPLYPLDSMALVSGTTTHATQKVSYTQGIPIYTSGYIQRQDRQPMAFVAKINRENEEYKVGWLREVGAKGRNTLPNGDKAPLHFAYSNGCIVFVTGEKDEGLKNTLIHLDSDGNEILIKPMEQYQKPIFVSYDEITKQFLMAFKQDPIDSLEVPASIILSQADSLGNISWNLPLEIDGEVVDIISTGGDYSAIMNYKHYNVNGKEGSANGWGTILVSVSNNGEINDINSIPSSYSYHTNRVFVVSSDELNLIGYEDAPGNSSGKLKYILSSPSGKVKYSNLDN